MALESSPSVVAEGPEKPARRGPRVLSERQVARKERLRETLVDPVVVAEDVDLLTETAHAIDRAFKPRNGWQDWLTSQIAVFMVRIDRCAPIERQRHDWVSDRAVGFWDEDQAFEVETLPLRIGQQPGRVVPTLKQSPAGLDWLLKRWRSLAKADPLTGTDDQTKRANPVLAEGQRSRARRRCESLACLAGL